MVSRKPIQLLVPSVPLAEDVFPYLKQIDSERWYTNFGPLAARFEEGVAKTIGISKNDVISVANCTLALEAALSAILPADGGSVLVPAITFVATASAVLRAGGNLVCGDISEESWQLTPEIAERVSMVRKIDCVIPVSAFGCAQPADEWDAFTRKTGVPVLIDAAGAFGNQGVGVSTSCAFSFHATKTLGIGEGGALVSRNPELIQKVRGFENFGINVKSGRAEHIGTNAKLSEFHAAVGLAALSSWGRTRNARVELHRAYVAQLCSQCPSVTLQERDMEGVYSILQILLPEGLSRNAIAFHLQNAGIQTRAWYQPLIPDHPAFSMIGAMDIPIARKLSPRMLGLPFHLMLDDLEIRYVCQVLADALSKGGN